MGRQGEMERLNVLDLFAGSGGFSEGFKKAGYRIVAANEVWQAAVDTYSTNHPETKMFAGDITSPLVKKGIVDFFKDKSCDVIIGGPPCQAYSVAGLRLPTDPRGNFFKDYLQIVEKLKPKVFVMENVKGLLYINVEKKGLKPRDAGKIRRIKRLKAERSALLRKKVRSKNSRKVKFTRKDGARYEYLLEKIPQLERRAGLYQRKLIDVIANRIRKLGYRTEYRIMNAADFGVPQVRERVILIAARDDIPIEFPTPTHSTDPSENLLPWTTVRQSIENLKIRHTDGRINHTFAVHGKKFMRKIKNTRLEGAALRSYKSSFLRLHPDKPSPTVKENHGAVFIHYDLDRVLTPRELARLQSFDDSYFFCSYKGDVLRQIGNAIPPALAYAVAKSVRSMFVANAALSERYKAEEKVTVLTNA